MSEEDHKHCAECGCEDEEMFLHSRCHTGAPTWVSVVGDTLIVRCAVPDCNKEVARFEKIKQLLN